MSVLSPLGGLWLPLVTPFIDGRVDEISLRKLVRYYAGKGISGLILAATTGEGQLLDDDELQSIATITAVEIDGSRSNLPLYLGISGSDPRKVCHQIAATHDWRLDGYLISGPNYLRPSQAGLFQYFRHAANATDRPVIVYNIPYRTGSNILNETMLEIASIDNIVGVKDCCGSADQSHELLRLAPKGFSVLSGEDPFFYNALVHGAPGAILTGAHVLVDQHLAIMKDLKSGNQAQALERWQSVAHVPGLLFGEPSPSPVKYWLWKQGLIDSPEVRLPFLDVGEELATQIDAAVAKFGQLYDRTG